MSDTEIEPGGFPHPPSDFATGPIAGPQRLVCTQSRVQPPALPAGSSHLTLFEWSPRQGPMVYSIVGNAGGSNLTGMGEAASIVERGFIDAIVMLIINIGTFAITTTENDVGSPEGERFSAPVSIGPGLAQAFVGADFGGVRKWVPLTYVLST